VKLHLITVVSRLHLIVRDSPLIQGSFLLQSFRLHLIIIITLRLHWNIISLLPDYCSNSNNNNLLLHRIFFKRKTSEVSAATPTPLSNTKTKNSTSEKRGSIVKSIDKLASSIGVANNNNQAAAAASMMQQFTAHMQMQMQAFSAQMQIQMERQSNMMRDQMEGNQRMMRAGLKQLKKKKKKKKRRSGPKFTLDSNATPVGNAGRGGNSSSSSSSSEGYSSYG
jgi:hypothetical protein